MAVGGWRLAVGGPWVLSLRVVLNKKKRKIGVPKDSPAAPISGELSLWLKLTPNPPNEPDTAASQLSLTLPEPLRAHPQTLGNFLHY